MTRSASVAMWGCVLLVVFATRSNAFFWPNKDDMECRTVKEGKHYSSPGDMGFTSGSSKSMVVRFDSNTAAYTTPNCDTSWNKLWGASRCGYLQSHHKDSDRFVWRKGSGANVGKIEVAAYAYDNGVKPYGYPPNTNLLQPFNKVLLVGVKYRLALQMNKESTIYTLSDESGNQLESKTVTHRSCKRPNRGYRQGLYFGGSCPAPHAVTVCYSDPSW